jgi:hypothetical protein
MSSVKKSRLGGVKTLKVSGILDEFEKDEVKKGVDIVSLFTPSAFIWRRKGRAGWGGVLGMRTPPPACRWIRRKDSTTALAVGSLGMPLIW